MKAACLLALLGLLALASASRVAPEFNSDDLSFGGSQGLQDVLLSIRSHGKHGGDRAYVATRYIVPTNKKQDFEKRWQELERSVSKEEGNDIVDLKKSKTDNYQYISYEEWGDKRAFVEHLESGYIQDFIDWTLQNNIVFETSPLLAPTKDTRNEGSKDAGKGKHHLTHVIIKYLVPPADAEDFVKAWSELQAETDKEKGVRIYSLRKPLGDNVNFIAYGTWDNWEAYQEHYDSKHLAKFLDFVDDREITWRLAPLTKIGDEPE